MADDGRSEQESPPNPSRRNLFKKMGAVALTAVLGLGFKLRSQESTPVKAEHQVFPLSPIERPELSPPNPEARLNRFILKDFTNTEITNFHQRVTNPEHLKSDEMRILDENGNYREDFRSTLSYIDQRYTPMIDQSFQTVQSTTNYKDIDPSWRDILKGIIYIESKGHEHPEADDRPDHPDRGLCQLRPVAVIEARKILGWENKVLNLWDPQTNITLALAYLMRLQEVFVDPSITIDTYNYGMGNMMKAIKGISAPYDRDKDVDLLVKENRWNILDIKDRRYGLDVLASTFISFRALQTRV
jgi:hypothetical protein